MSYYSDNEYAKRTDEKDLWLDRLNYTRWFRDLKGPMLDIGCATGNFISNNPSQMEGIDIDEDSLAIARTRGFRVQQLNAATELGTLPSRKYIGIYAKHVIEHLESPLPFVKEIYRLLAPGGIAVISTPNCPYTLSRMFYDDYTHVRPLTRRALQMLAHDAGCGTVVTITEDFRCLPGLGRLMRMTGVTPSSIRRAQDLVGIRGLSLILRIQKPKDHR